MVGFKAAMKNKENIKSKTILTKSSFRPKLVTLYLQVDIGFRQHIHTVALNDFQLHLLEAVKCSDLSMFSLDEPEPESQTQTPPNVGDIWIW